MESLQMVVTEAPPSVRTQDRKLLAACVTTPSKQATCAAAASALRRNEETAVGADRLLAAALARPSTSLLARQSMEVKL